MSFLPIGLAEQSWQGKRVKSFLFLSFSLNTTLSPVSTLWRYLERTTPLREEERKLFILLSFINQHKAVTSRSIARWSQLILENAGINSAIFGAHSTQGAWASAAFRAGVRTSNVLQAANWSSESVFQKFYHKEVDKAACSRAIFTQNSSKSATNNTTDVWDYAFWYICNTQNGKDHRVVASYSGLYDGDVEHINCPHSPSHCSGEANQRPKEMA